MLSQISGQAGVGAEGWWSECPGSAATIGAEGPGPYGKAGGDGEI
jgi:hypothetical protein